MNSIKLLILSVTLFTFGGLFALYAKSLTIVCCGLALVIFFLPFINRYSYLKCPSTSKFFNVIYMLLLIWELFIVFYPFLMNQSFISDGYSLRVDYTLPAYFLPLILLLGRDSVRLDYLLKIVPGLLGFSLLIAILNKQFWFEDYANLTFDEYQDALEMTGPLMSLLNLGLLLLPFVSYIPQKYIKVMVFANAFLNLMFCVIAARRGGVVLGLLYVIAYIYFSFFCGKRKIPKWLVFCVVGAFIVVGLYFLLNSMLVSYLLERGIEDTRSYVEFFLYNDFSDHYADWIFGRGINGAYYCPLFKNVMRQVIETGYLFMILKGGIIYLFLYVALYLHAIIRAFKSGNILLKIMAAELIIRLFSLYPFGLPAFRYTDLLCWIFILYCETTSFGKNKASAKNHSNTHSLINTRL